MFLRKKIHDIKLCLKTIQEQVKKESQEASLHDEFKLTSSKNNDIDLYLC